MNGGGLFCDNDMLTIHFPAYYMTTHQIGLMHWHEILICLLKPLLRKKLSTTMYNFPKISQNGATA